MPAVLCSLSDHSRLNQPPAISVASEQGALGPLADAPLTGDGPVGDDLAQLGLRTYCLLPKTSRGKWWRRYVDFAAGLGAERHWVELIATPNQLSDDHSSPLNQAHLQVMVTDSVDTVAFAQLLITNIVSSSIFLK